MNDEQGADEVNAMGDAAGDPRVFSLNEARV